MPPSRAEKEHPNKAHWPSCLYASPTCLVSAPIAVPVSPLAAYVGGHSMPHASADRVHPNLLSRVPYKEASPLIQPHPLCRPMFISHGERRGSPVFPLSAPPATAHSGRRLILCTGPGGAPHRGMAHRAHHATSSSMKLHRAMMHRHQTYPLGERCCRPISLPRIDVNAVPNFLSCAGSRPRPPPTAPSFSLAGASWCVGETRLLLHHVPWAAWS
jgi:hypothetical protein